MFNICIVVNFLYKCVTVYYKKYFKYLFNELIFYSICLLWFCQLIYLVELTEWEFYLFDFLLDTERVHHFLFIPLLLFCVNCLHEGNSTSKLFWSVFSIFLIFVKFSILLFYVIKLKHFYFIHSFSWVNFFVIQLNLTFCYDTLSILMVVVISFVSFLVHLFSIDYMAHDKNRVTFLSYLNLFTFFMILLVVAGNLVLLFIGWEGVGITSYLLINFWCTRFEANKSSLKAIVINKVGDITLFLFIGLSFYFFNSVEIVKIKFLILSNSLDPNLLLLLGVLLFVSAVAKSSQLGLHTWLPDAMEGPTPVSALLHAATMVTAGIYLLIRFSFLVEKLPALSNLIILTGSLTAVFGSLLALVQVDIKKIIAFSTLSQLGYMFTAIGLTGYNLSMYHLVTHASFKALLFLCAGVIIHNLNNDQDIRKYGGLLNLTPLLYSYMLVGFLALSGLPFLAGFYSKDLIIELSMCFVYKSYITFLATLLLNFGAFLTTFYSIRSIYYIFFATTNVTVPTLKNLTKVKDLNLIQFLSLTPLLVGSIFLGRVMYRLLVGQPSNFFWATTIASFYPLRFIETLSTSLKLIPFFCFVVGLLLATTYYFFIDILSFLNSKNLLNSTTYIKLKNLTLNSTLTLIYKFFVKYLYRKFYYDIFLNRLVGKFFLTQLYKYTFYTIDRGILQNVVENCSGKALTKFQQFFKLNKFLNFFNTQLKIILTFYLFGLIVFFLSLIVATFIYFNFI